MERRKLPRRKVVVTAGALAVTAFAATLAIGANFGLAGRAEPDSPVGRLDAPTSGSPIVTVATTKPPPTPPTLPADD